MIHLVNFWERPGPINLGYLEINLPPEATRYLVIDRLINDDFFLRVIWVGDCSSNKSIKMVVPLKYVTSGLLVLAVDDTGEYNMVGHDNVFAVIKDVSTFVANT